MIATLNQLGTSDEVQRELTTRGPIVDGDFGKLTNTAMKEFN